MFLFLFLRYVIQYTMFVELYNSKCLNFSLIIEKDYKKNNYKKTVIFTQQQFLTKSIFVILL